MKISAGLCLAALAGLGAAHPVSHVKRQGANMDVNILQFALTLEHLENVFYKEALGKFSQDDFTKAGFNLDFLPNLQFLVEDEQSHVTLLTQAIQATGTTPVAACKYNFPYTDVQSFVTLSSVLEGVGTSAYLGAAGLIMDKTILNTAGSILVTEALHTSQQRGALGEIPAANALGTPVSANGIFTVASAFISSCPDSNPKLPFTAFPSLTAENDCPPEGSPAPSPSADAQQGMTARMAQAAPPTFTAAPPSPAELADLVAPDAIGVNAAVPVALNNVQVVDTVSVCAPPSAGGSATFTAASAIPMGSFVTFVSGLTTTSVQGTISGSSIQAAVPEGVSGQTYVFITNANVTASVMDQAVVAGPAVLEVGPPAPKIDDSVQ